MLYAEGLLPLQIKLYALQWTSGPLAYDVSTVRVHYGKYCTRAWSRANKARGAAECYNYSARDHAPSAIFSVMHERERYFNWFIVAEFLASAALNDSKWALRSKLPITMLGRNRGKTGEPL